MRSRTRSYTPDQPCVRARSPSLENRGWNGVRVGVGISAVRITYTDTNGCGTHTPQTYTYELTHTHTQACTPARVYVSVGERRSGEPGCRRVAEVSLTLDGVPVRIVILRDAQRRGVLRVSAVYPLVVPISRASVRPSAIRPRRGANGRISP